jgi:hypothetical protein
MRRMLKVVSAIALCTGVGVISGCSGGEPIDTGGHESGGSGVGGSAGTGGALGGGGLAGNAGSGAGRGGTAGSGTAGGSSCSGSAPACRGTDGRGCCANDPYGTATCRDGEWMCSFSGGPWITAPGCNGQSCTFGFGGAAGAR